jgi:hypothetical protein
LVLLALAVALPMASTPAVADSSNISIANVTVSPDQPAPGQLVEIETTVRNAGQNGDLFEITDVYVRSAGGTNDLARVENLGTVTADTSTTIPLTLSFDEEGVKELRITVVGRTEGGNLRRATYPETVVVTDGGPQMALDLGETNADGETTVLANVSNGDRQSFRDLELVVNGSNVDVERSRRIVATLEAGSTRSFTYTAEFPNETSRLDAYLQYRTEQGESRSLELNRTVDPDEVRPGDSGLQMVLDVGETNADGETTVVANVSNGDDESYRNLDLSVSGPQVEVEQSRRVAATLASGTTRSFEYTVEFPNRTSRLDASLTYRTEGGTARSIDLNRTVDPDEVDPAAGNRPLIETSVQTALPGATRSMNVTVENGLDSDIDQVNVTVESPTASFGTSERVQATLAAGSNRTFRFPTTVDEAGTHRVDVTLSYTVDGEYRQVGKTFRPTFDAPPNPGEITLTDVSAVKRGSQLEVSATAGNVGSSTVEGVVVSIDGSDALAGADYFVGSVEGSDFSSFTLSTTATGDVSSVPLNVTYAVGGVQRSYTREVPVQQVDVATPTQSGSGPGLLAFAPIVVVAVVVLVVLYGIVRYLR